MDYWNLYKDVWNFHKKYSKVQTDDAYWEAVVSESGQIAERKSTRLNSRHSDTSRIPTSA